MNENIVFMICVTAIIIAAIIIAAGMSAERAYLYESIHKKTCGECKNQEKSK